MTVSISSVFAICVALFANAAAADCPQSGVGETLLVINGDIGSGERDCRVAIDLEWLDALPQVSLSTSTPWTEGTKMFTGPTLNAVLQKVEAGGGDILGLASNDYSSIIPRGFIDDAFPLIVTRIDGSLFTLRENGPLWIVYPFDRESDYPLDLAMQQSIWQLVSLTVRPADSK